VQGSWSALLYRVPGRRQKDSIRILRLCRKLASPYPQSPPKASSHAQRYNTILLVRLGWYVVRILLVEDGPMKRTLLLALALAVIPVAVDAQNLDVDYWQALAERGDPTAQNNLGVMFEHGLGVPRDAMEAVRWYRLAAEQGLVDAQTNLGIMYFSANGVPEDNVLAYMWMNLAAAQGNESAGPIREVIMGRMTREQIDEAQRMSTEWVEAHSPGGN